MDFSMIHGDTTMCAFEDSLHRVEFEDHIINLDDSISIGDFCGGFELIEDKMFITTFDSEDNTFKIIESDYYLNNQKVIYEKRYDYRVKALSYNRVIYFGEPKGWNKELIVEAYDLTSKEYLGVLLQSNGLSYHDYVQKIRNKANRPYDIDREHNQILNDTYVKITKIDTQEIKYVNDDQLLRDNVGQKIIEQKKYFWSHAEYGKNDRIYLICSIWSHEYSFFSNYLFNVVYEYDFETNSLKFKFYFISYDYEDLYLYFGYE